MCCTIAPGALLRSGSRSPGTGSLRLVHTGAPPARQNPPPWDQPPWALNYPPIFHLLCSDAVQHPLTKQVLWRTHKLWTLACLWPTYTQVVEQTECGAGVRVTVRF